MKFNRKARRLNVVPVGRTAIFQCANYSSSRSMTGTGSQGTPRTMDPKFGSARFRPLPDWAAIRAPASKQSVRWTSHDVGSLHLPVEAQSGSMRCVGVQNM